MKSFSVSLWLLVFITAFSALGMAQPKPLMLGECIQTALKHNPEVRNAYRQIDVAGSGIISARSTILPYISGSASSSHSEQAPRTFLQDVPIGIDPVTKQVTYAQREIVQSGYSRNSHNLGVSLSQTIYDGGKWWNRIREANASYRSAEWSYKSTRQAIILQVTQRYFELLKALQLQDVYEKAVKSSEEQFRKTQSMYEVGAVAQVDVYKAKVTLGQAKMNLINQKKQVLIAKSNLNVVLGRNPASPLQIVQKDIEWIPFTGTVEEAKRIALSNNPGLRSLKEQIVSNKFAIKVAKGDYLPQISARASYSRFNTLLDRVYSKWDKNYGISVSLSVNWNFFNGFQREANISRQNLNYLIAKENLSNQQRALLQSVEQAFMNLQAYREIYEINKENLKAAEEDLRLAQERYKVGSGTLLEVVDAQVSLTRSRATLVSTKYDNLIALAQMYNSMGSLEQKISKLVQK
ncbi:MAG: TolC family protein [Calditrichaeota bacterium]|nr:TolC family protein [Calditrichota bacterium]